MNPFGSQDEKPAESVFGGTGQDEFGQADTTGGGLNFRKLATLENVLVMIEPTDEVERNKYNSTDTEPYLVANTIILTGVEAGTVIHNHAMNGSKMVRAGKTARNKGQKYILGTVVKVPTWPDVKSGKYKDGDTAGILKAIQEWVARGGAGEKPNFAWGLAPYTPADAQVAREYLVKRPQFANAA